MTTQTLTDSTIARSRDAIIARLTREAYTPTVYTFPPLPGWDGSDRIGVRLLRDGEIDLCRAEAQRWCSRLKVDLALDPDLLERDVEREVVWRATSIADAKGDNGEPVPFFPSPADVRDMPAVIVRALFDLYLENHARMSPQRSYSAEQLTTLAQQMRAAPGPTVTAVSQLDHGSLVNLVRELLVTPITPVAVGEAQAT